MHVDPQDRSEYYGSNLYLNMSVQIIFKFIFMLDIDKYLSRLLDDYSGHVQIAEGNRDNGDHLQIYIYKYKLLYFELRIKAVTSGSWYIIKFVIFV